MTKPTDIFLRKVTSDTEHIDFRTPIKFGGRVMNAFVLLNVTVEAETRDGRRGRGFGSMPMAGVWAWPGKLVSADDACRAMLELGRRLADAAGRYREAGHPLEITSDLEHSYEPLAEEVVRAAGLAEPMPRLAQLVAASPLEAAIHDAYGKALGASSYNLLGSEFVARDLADYLTGEFAGEYLDRYTLREPKPRMPLYHLVGALDPLDAGDVTDPVGDGLPETLAEWIPFNGLTHLKIKLAGDDLAWDVDAGAGSRAGGGPRPRRPAAAPTGTTRPTSTRSAPTSSTCSTFWPRSRKARRRRSAGSNTSSSRPAATCGRIPKTACTAPPRSSPW